MQNNGDRISSCVYIKGTHNKKRQNHLNVSLINASINLDKYICSLYDETCTMMIAFVYIYLFFVAGVP